MRLFRVACVLAFFAAAGAAHADDAGSLYAVRNVVTGQGAESRALAVTRGFPDVLVKVSGDPRLRDDPRVAALAGEAAGMVASVAFRDRMAGIPVHDEQGSRDRPYVATVAFDAGRIDAALRGLGSRPWPSPRPPVAARIEVVQGPAPYILLADGAQGLAQREALLQAAWQAGLTVTLPAARNAPLGDGAALAGRMFRDDAAGLWVATWELGAGGKTHAWRTRDATFDLAFRGAMEGAAAVLSGNAPPP